jgi:anti-sigma regulatory factor (Ser/Thr protein kinase)
MGTTTSTHTHACAFYDRDQDIVDQVVRFVGDGLDAGEPAVIIVTPEHRVSIDQGLTKRGLDLVTLVDEGRYVPLDARETLNLFMADGSPHPDRFEDVVGGVVRTASRSGVPVRAFGEMVAILWAAGNVMAAIELEELWNDLGTRERFSLLCAYSLASVTGPDDLEALTKVCSTHTDLVGPDSYDRGVADGSRTTFTERSATFIPVFSAIAAARAFTEQALDAWGMQTLKPDATIVVSELATNALMHARSAFRVRLTRTEDSIRFAVDDVDETTTPASPPQTTAMIGGFGMVLVNGLASRWGTDLLPHGKSVWCEFALDR